MRNGNTGITSLPAGREPSSYPTYEEWKPSNLEQLYSCFRSRSYPTYEEWKLQRLMRPAF